MKGYTEYRIRRRAAEVKRMIFDMLLEIKYQISDIPLMLIVLMLAWVLVHGQEVILRVLGGVW